MVNQKKGRGQKPTTKKPAIGKKVATPPKEEDTTLGALIKKAEKVIIVTATRGNIEVTGLKDVNYSHEAKGLLHGALDTYNTRPVINTITNLGKGLITNLQNIQNQVIELNPNKNTTPSEEAPAGTEKKEEKNNEQKERLF